MLPSQLEKKVNDLRLDFCRAGLIDGRRDATVQKRNGIKERHVGALLESHGKNLDGPLAVELVHVLGNLGAISFPFPPIRVRNHKHDRRGILGSLVGGALGAQKPL